MKNVEFLLDKALDIDIGDSFMDEKIGEYEFGKERILDLHPDLLGWQNKPGSERTDAVTAYVNDFYSNHSTELDQSIEKARSTWQEIENAFFQEMIKLLGELHFYEPKTMYGKPSIFACAVIEDDGKSFQFHYRLPLDDPNEFKRNVAHELVHFLTDAFMKSNGFTNLLEDWDFREILPVLILNEPNFLGLTKKEEKGYPQHQGSFTEKCKDLWQKSANFLEFLDKAQASKQ